MITRFSTFGREMNSAISGKWIASAGLALLAALPGVASAQIAIADSEEGVNYVSIGAGSAPEYLGASQYKIKAAPAGRLYFLGQRYVQLLGPQLSVNVLDNADWQFGPQILYRLKRGGTDNAQVNQLPQINGTAEFGLFGLKSWTIDQNPLHRFNIRTDLQGGKNGAEGTLTAQYFMPVSRAVVLNAGGGFGYANSKWMNTYAGVSTANAFVYPSLNGQAYSPSGGLIDFRLNAAAIISFSEAWHVAVGARYQRLQSAISNGPIVTSGGNANQWVYGAALGYTWK